MKTTTSNGPAVGDMTVRCVRGCFNTGSSSQFAVMVWTGRFPWAVLEGGFSSYGEACARKTELLAAKKAG